MASKLFSIHSSIKLGPESLVRALQRYKSMEKSTRDDGLTPLSVAGYFQPTRQPSLSVHHTIKLSVNDWGYPAKTKSKILRYRDSQVQALPLRLLPNTNNYSYFVYAGVVRLPAAIVTVSACSATEQSASSDLHFKKVRNGRNAKVPEHVQLLRK